MEGAPSLTPAAGCAGGFRQPSMRQQRAASYGSRP